MNTQKIIGNSTPMVNLKKEIDVIAKSNVTVLISGETGTGKELVAQRIHMKSQRAKGPFVAINIASLNDNIVESELFGHKKGSFTGANTERKGLFREADGGTLFLDEIGDISPTMQVKLLRVLQEKEVCPVGSNIPVPVDVRVVVATHKNLFSMAESGKFRADLFYRLNVFPLHIPALRDRDEDVWELYEYFVNNYLKKENRPNTVLDGSLKDNIMSWHWPGNVRELQNVAHSTVLRSISEVISCNELPFTFIKNLNTFVKCNEMTSGSISSFSSTTKIKKELLQTEKNVTDYDENSKIKKNKILVTIKKVNGNKTKAAKILNMSRTTLYKQLGILQENNNSISTSKPSLNSMDTRKGYDDKYKIKKNEIRITLEKVNGNKTKAAEILNISRATLYKRLDIIEDERSIEKHVLSGLF